MCYVLGVGSPPWEVVSWKLSRLSSMASAYARYKYALEYSQRRKLEIMVLAELGRRHKKQIVWKTDLGEGMVKLGLVESMIERSLPSKVQAFVVNTSYASWRKHRKMYGLYVRKIYSNLESELYSV